MLAVLQSLPMAEKMTFDHYEVLTREDGSLSELGRGAMGITYKAFDTNLRVNVALKVINAKYLESEIAQQRFMREARAAAQLRHPNVASVFHLGTSRDAFFYAMEFVDGETVESFIKRQGPIDPLIALRITLQVARALGAAAKHHLVHRDIKPANLMLVREDDDFLVKVIDFGLAKSIKHEENDDLATLSMGGFVGTAHFASPEQLEEKEIDVRSDIYSLGVTLWYMLAGQVPFAGSLAQVMSQHLHKPPPLEKLQNLPECVGAVVGHMIEKDPAKRPQTPGALRAELENCLALIEAAPPAGEEDFPTMVEATTVPRAVEPPKGACPASMYQRVTPNE
jgi:serine/threonine protein kinase